jgi:hypothetical protein
MNLKQFEKIITNEFLQDKDVKGVYCVKVAKSMIENNLHKQELENIIYTWSFCRGVIVINYCEK